MSEITGILKSISDSFELSEVDPNGYSPLALAFLGDSVYGLVVKTVITMQANCPANMLNNKTTEYVKAVSQAKIVQLLQEEGMLSEEEENILRRGRNAKSASKAKNASVGEYRVATGLETLMGYLYLKGETDRMVKLVRVGMELFDSKEAK